MPNISLSTELKIFGIVKEPYLVTISKNDPVPKFRTTMFAFALFPFSITRL